MELLLRSSSTIPHFSEVVFLREQSGAELRADYNPLLNRTRCSEAGLLKVSVDPPKVLKVPFLGIR